MPDPLICRRSLRVGATSFAGLLGFTVVGYLLVRDDESAGWLGLLFFGPMSLAQLALLMDRRPQLIVGGDGLWIRSRRTIAPIPWSDVVWVHVDPQKHGWLTVVAQNLEAYIPPNTTVNKLAAALRLPVLSPDTARFPVFVLDASADEILRAVDAFG